MTRFKLARSAVFTGLCVLGGGGLFFSNPAYAQFSGSDDFSSANSFWTTNWDFNASLSPVGGQLVYTTGATPSGNDSSNWRWSQNYGNANTNWSMRIDVSIAPSALADFRTNMDLVVANLSDPDPYGNIFRVHLRGGYFYADFFAGRNLVGYTFAPTNTTSASLGIGYDAATGMLTAAYDADGALNGYQFESFFSQPISMWNFSTSNPLEAFIYGQTGDLLVTPGMMSFDNFQISGEALPVAAVPEPETYAMLLAGLGLLGFAARRRKLKAAVAA